MAEPDKSGKKDDEAARQAQRQTEAVRRPPDTITNATEASRPHGMAASLSETVAGEGRGRAGEGMERMIGGAERAADATVSGVGNAASGALRSAGSVGGSAIGVTRDVLNNVISATEEVGSNLVGGVTHVAIDVVHGVGDVGESAVHIVTDLLAALVGGVKTVVTEVLPSGTATAEGERTPTEQEAQYRSKSERVAEEAIH